MISFSDHDTISGEPGGEGGRVILNFKSDMMNGEERGPSELRGVDRK